MLAGLASGDAAIAFEKQSPEAIVERVLRVLRGIFEPQGVEVPQPVQVAARRLTEPSVPFHRCALPQ